MTLSLVLFFRYPQKYSILNHVLHFHCQSCTRACIAYKNVFAHRSVSLSPILRFDICIFWSSLTKIINYLVHIYIGRRIPDPISDIYVEWQF